MTAFDPGFHVVEAPPLVEAPPPADDPSAKTESIDRSGSGNGVKFAIGVVLLALIAGIAFAVIKDRFGASSAGASVSADADEAGASAPDTGLSAEIAKTCSGDLSADENLKWYCGSVVPFVQKARADHLRIDRLEAELKKRGGGNGIPISLWIILAAIGVLTVYNTVNARRQPPKAPQE